MKKVLVISAINITEGGPLTILKDCVEAALELLAAEWDVYVLVHDEKLLKTHPSLQLIQFPKAKSSWLNRLYYEWWHFYKLSRSLKPDLWLSLHDITPRVIAKKRVVYCHNPSSFYSISIREAWLDPRFLLFNLFYKYLYRIGIRKNEYVVVQQNWIRDEFQSRYGLNNVIVAYPQSTNGKPESGTISKLIESKNIFIYPAFPRVFKNIETVCEAATRLAKSGVENFELRLTISGRENRYANWLYEQYSEISQIKFLGLLSSAQMSEQYAESDCLIFPSKIETWGLPITEAKNHHLSLFVADLPYAHETVGSYHQVCFFKHNDAKALAELMESFIRKEVKFLKTKHTTPESIFVDGWAALISKITKD